MFLYLCTLEVFVSSLQREKMKTPYLTVFYCMNISRPGQIFVTLFLSVLFFS
jgi:hypothetical protein